MKYARAFDFSRPFFEQFGELQRSVPHCALMNVQTENSEYCNETDSVKDSYMAICTFYGERLFHTYWTAWSNDCFDCSYILKNDQCYDCQDLQDSYGCRSVYLGSKMVDSMFCIGSSDCVNCFMCVNLHHKSYYIRNKQYTKEEYFLELAKYDVSSHQSTERLKQELLKFSLSFPRRYAAMRNAENCVGDYVWSSKDIYRGFDVFEVEHGRYVYDSGGGKDFMDSTHAGIESELMYESHSVGKVYNTYFANFVQSTIDCEYVESCIGVQNIFGGVGLKKKQYCIFNMEYTKDEYEELRLKIIAHMQKTGEYGEFFSVDFSPFAYNETTAQQWYPKTKEEVLARGWKWRDELPGKYGHGTIAWDKVSDRISDINETMIAKVFSCNNCNKQYKIVKQEFAFYKAHTIPLPRQCPDCRFYDRLKLRNPRKLWHRQCMCERTGHASHTGRCANQFETTYTPDRPEIVYCEQCYQAEVV